MKTFREFIDNDVKMEESLLLLSFIMSDNNLNESSVFKDKFGTRETSVIDYLLKFGRVYSKIILAGFRKDAESIETLSKEITLSHFLDFLLKLDDMTMNIITGPLAIIASVTGWDLKAVLVKISQSAKDQENLLRKSLETAKETIHRIFLSDLDKKAQLLSLIRTIETSIIS